VRSPAKEPTLAAATIRPIMMEHIGIPTATVTAARGTITVPLEAQTKAVSTPAATTAVEAEAISSIRTAVGRGVTSRGQNSRVKVSGEGANIDLGLRLGEA